MKTVYMLAISLALTLVLSVQADLKTPDEMSKMNIKQLHAYFKTLNQNEFNTAMKSIVDTGNARLIRVGIAAAQKTINETSFRSSSGSEQPPGGSSSLTGTVGADGNVLLAKSDATPKTSKIGRCPHCQCSRCYYTINCKGGRHWRFIRAAEIPVSAALFLAIERFCCERHTCFVS